VVHARDRSLVLAPVAAIGWLSLAVLGFVVRIALFRFHRTHGATAVLWGLGFGLFLWAGSASVGLEQERAIPFGLVAGAAIALLVYLRGAGLEDPPAAQPGAFYRRRQSSRAPEANSRPDVSKPRDLHRARVALTDGDLDGALFYLRQAERVAVAQRKLDELLEVRELLSSLPETPAGERLEWEIGEALHDFPAGDLAAAGIHVQTQAELLESLRRRAGGQTTAELAPARQALEQGDFANALFELRQARHVAVAQRRLGELLDVYDLVQVLCERSSGRTRLRGEALAREVEAALRSFA